MSSYSPQELRIDAIARFVVKHREMGKSDSAIRELLLIQEHLSPMHPCADARGFNICQSGEIDTGMGKAGAYADAFEKARAESAARAAVLLQCKAAAYEKCIAGGKKPAVCSPYAAAVCGKAKGGGIPWLMIAGALGVGFILWRSS